MNNVEEKKINEGYMIYWIILTISTVNLYIKLLSKHNEKCDVSKI